MRSEFKFERVADGRIAEAFDVLNRAIVWTRTKGRRQRIANTTRAVYQQWQKDEANFSVTMKGRIVGVATLNSEPLVAWPKFQDLGAVQMLRALATCPEHRGLGIGTFAIRSIVERFGCTGPVFLDCVQGFLPGYYEKQGFELVAQRSLVTDTDGGRNDICLMKYSKLKN